VHQAFDRPFAGGVGHEGDDLAGAKPYVDEAQAELA